MGKETSERVEFSIAAASRHPRDVHAYNPLSHKYRDDYVHPSGWRLELEMGAKPLEENVVAYEWLVEQVEGDFRHRVSYEDKVTSIEDISVEVPAQGEYLITLTVTLKDGRELTYRRDFFLRDYLIVAIGDSYFCGEGNPDVGGKPKSILGSLACNLATFTKFLAEKVNLPIPMEREAEWQEKRVHRSYKSGPSLAVDELQAPGLGIVITFLNFARTGSTVEEGLLGPRPEDEWTDVGQIEEAKGAIGERPIDALLISIGGNDIEFPDRLLDLIRDDLMIVGAGGGLGDDALNRRQEVREAKKRLRELPDRLERLAEAVETLDAAQVYLTEYPNAHFETINEHGEVVVGSGCGIFEGPDMDIDGKDAQAIKESGEKLNHELRRIAQKRGWIMVKGIVDAFAGHGLCAVEPYFISAEESCRIQGDFEGTMHPNQRGHSAYGECIHKAIYQYTISRDAASNVSPTAQMEEVTN